MVGRHWIVALSLLATTSGLMAQAAAAAPAGVENPDEASLLNFGQGELLKGEPTAAMARYFDPIIARYEKSYGGDRRRVYAARSSTETLYYVTLGAAEKRDTVVLGPTWADAVFFKGYALIDLARSKEARQWFEKAVALSPQNSRYISELANTYQSAKQFLKSLELFTAAAEAARTATPDDAKAFELGRALRGEAFALTELDRLDESTALYKQCLILDPNDKIATSELAYVAGLRTKKHVATPS